MTQVTSWSQGKEANEGIAENTEPPCGSLLYSSPSYPEVE